MKNFELLPGKVCSMTLKPLALHSSMDKTPIGKEMFIRNTSGPKDPSSKSKNCFSGTVSAKSQREKKKKKLRQSLCYILKQDSDSTHSQ